MMTIAVGLGLALGFILFLYVLDGLFVAASRRGSAADKERKE